MTPDAISPERVSTASSAEVMIVSTLATYSAARVKPRSGSRRPSPSAAMLRLTTKRATAKRRINASEHPMLARRMRRRRASSSVKWAIVNTPSIRSSRPLIVAHDVEEKLLERTPPAVQAVHADSLVHERFHNQRQRLFAADTQPHESVSVTCARSKAGKSVDDRRT